MKKFFVTIAVALMVAFASGCTCSRQTETVADETVVETVDSTAAEVLDAVDSTLTVTEE